MLVTAAVLVGFFFQAGFCHSRVRAQLESFNAVSDDVSSTVAIGASWLGGDAHWRGVCVQTCGFVCPSDLTHAGLL